MVDISFYMICLLEHLKQKFGTRLHYVGLQGSYLRGEATENSDIDVMVILDTLSVSDLECYRHIVSNLDHSEKSCGFICGRDDLANWNPLEICSLLNGTKDIYGKLTDYVPEYGREDVRNFVKMGLNNLYHELCHRYIHGNRDRTVAAMSGMYKSAFYLLQNLHYLRCGTFVGTKTDLLICLEGKDREVLLRCLGFGKGVSYPFPESFDILFSWCQETLQTV